MLRHFMWLVLFSVAIVLTFPYLHKAVSYLLWMHQWVSSMLGEIFSTGKIGEWLRDIVAILVIPLIVGAIPALVFWIVRGRMLPFFMWIVWVVWLLEVSALLTIKG